MMKSRWVKIALGLMLVIGVFAFSGTPFADAAGASTLSSNRLNSDGIGSVDVEGVECSIWPGEFSIAGCATMAAAYIVYYLLWIMSWFMWVAGVALNMSISYTILNARDNINGITAISAAWGAIRDVANIGFIFVLLYEAMKIVLQQGGNAQKVIKNVVIAALLINFSMFFTKAAIDASNIITIGIYNQIAASESKVGGNAFSTSGITDFSNYLPTDAGLSDAFMRPLGLSGFFDANAINNLARTGGKSVIITGIAGTIMILIAAFIFVVVAFMFVARFVILILLIILSPIAFVSAVYQNSSISGQKSQWVKSLTAQCTWPPVYMLLTWIVLKILNDPNFKAGNNANKSETLASVFNSMAGVGLIMNYAIVIIFLVSTIIIAKQTASSGGGFASSLMRKAENWGGSMGGRLANAGAATATAAPALAYRQSVGRFGNRLANSESAKMRAAEGGVGGWVARKQLAIGKSMSGGSGDARSMLGGLGIGVKADSRGFKQRRDDKKKEKDSYKKEADAIKRKIDTKKTIEDGVAAERDIAAQLKKGIPITALPKDLLDKQRQLRKTAGGLNTADMEAMDKDTLKGMLKHVRADQMENLLKSEKFSESDKEAFKKARFKDTYDLLEKEKKGQQLTAAEKKALGVQVRGLTVKDFGMIDPELLENDRFIERLNKKQVDNLTKPDSYVLTAEQKFDLETKYKALTTSQQGAAGGQQQQQAAQNVRQNTNKKAKSRKKGGGGNAGGGAAPSGPQGGQPGGPAGQGGQGGGNPGGGQGGQQGGGNAGGGSSGSGSGNPGGTPSNAYQGGQGATRSFSPGQTSTVNVASAAQNWTGSVSSVGAATIASSSSRPAAAAGAVAATPTGTGTNALHLNTLTNTSRPATVETISTAQNTKPLNAPTGTASANTVAATTASTAALGGAASISGTAGRQTINASAALQNAAPSATASQVKVASAPKPQAAPTAQPAQAWASGTNDASRPLATAAGATNDTARLNRINAMKSLGTSILDSQFNSGTPVSDSTLTAVKQRIMSSTVYNQLDDAGKREVVTKLENDFNLKMAMKANGTAAQQPQTIQ